MLLKCKAVCLERVCQGSVKRGELRKLSVTKAFTFNACFVHVVQFYIVVFIQRPFDLVPLFDFHN